MKQLIEQALESSIWTVVGATTNQAKFGNKIYRRLKAAGYRVYALNPVYADIEGDPCYGNPGDLPETPECASIVVAPDKGQHLLQPLYDRGVRLLWFQPGAYDQKLLDDAVAKGFDIIYDYCILVELNNTGR